jgi:hypothetical protein
MAAEIIESPAVYLPGNEMSSFPLRSRQIKPLPPIDIRKAIGSLK